MYGKKISSRLNFCCEDICHNVLNINRKKASGVMSRTNFFTKGFVAFICIALLIVVTTFSAYADPSGVISKYKTVSAPYVIPPINCYTTLYILSRTKPVTSKCLIPGKMANGQKIPVTHSGEIPNTYTTSCYNPLTSLAIFSHANGSVCFVGNGYLGIRLDGVYYLSTEFVDTSPGWVRYYNPTGNYFYFDIFSAYGCPWFCGNTEITQVDITGI